MWFWRRFFSFSVLTVSCGLGLGLEPLWTFGLDKGGLDYSPTPGSHIILMCVKRNSSPKMKLVITYSPSCQTHTTPVGGNQCSGSTLWLSLTLNPKWNRFTSLLDTFTEAWGISVPPLKIHDTNAQSSMDPQSIWIKWFNPSPMKDIIALCDQDII